MKQLWLLAAALALCSCGPTTASNGGGETASATAPAAPADAQLTVSPSAAYITAAIANTRRPAEDRANDYARRPAEILALSNIAPGQSVGELIPGGGYFPRLFSLAVGARGHVYTVVRLHPSQYERPVAEDVGNVATIHA